MKRLLNSKSEQFSADDKKNIANCAARSLAWVHKANMILGHSSGRSSSGRTSRARAIVKRWFADPATTDTELDAYIEKLSKGFKQITATLNRGSIILTDYMGLRGATAADELSFLNAEAFTFRNYNEGLDVVYIEKAFFKDSPGNVLGPEANWARILIHELTHLCCNTIDVVNGKGPLRLVRHRPACRLSRQSVRYQRRQLGLLLRRLRRCVDRSAAQQGAEDHMTGRAAAVLLAAVLAVSAPFGAWLASADEPGAPAEETKEQTMDPDASVPPAPEAAPVEHKGVRYQEKADTLGGVLEAVDIATGKTLWTLKVYESGDDSAPVDGIGNYFTSITVGPGDDQLTIESGVGYKYEVDLATRTSEQISAPPPKKPFSVPG